MRAPLRGGPESLKAGARLFELARAVTAGEISEEASLAGRERFLDCLGRDAGQAHIALVVWAGVGVLAVALGAHRLARPERSSRSVEGAVVSGNGYVSVGAHSKPSVHFVGGSRVAFAAGSRGRVGEPSTTRAQVVLEGGRATVHGEARPQVGFLVEAGPYALKSGGAAYDVVVGERLQGPRGFRCRGRAGSGHLRGNDTPPESGVRDDRSKWGDPMFLTGDALRARPFHG